MNSNINNTQELTFEQMNMINGGYVVEEKDNTTVYDASGEPVEALISLFDIIQKMINDLIEKNYTIHQDCTVQGDNNTISC